MKKCWVIVVVVLCASLWICKEAYVSEKKDTQAQTPSATASSLTGKSGKDLFNDPALGTNGKSCHSCHKDVKVFSGVAEKYNKNHELENMINKCIVGALKGKELDLKSHEMEALSTFLRSL
jgi:hypothetical protein